MLFSTARLDSIGTWSFSTTDLVPLQYPRFSRRRANSEPMPGRLREKYALAAWSTLQWPLGREAAAPISSSWLLWVSEWVSEWEVLTKAESHIK